MLAIADSAGDLYLWTGAGGGDVQVIIAGIAVPVVITPRRSGLDLDCGGEGGISTGIVRAGAEAGAVELGMLGDPIAEGGSANAEVLLGGGDDGGSGEEDA